MFLFAFYSLISYAPANTHPTMYIPKCERVISLEALNYYPLVEAVFKWETRGSMDTLSYNAREGAYGGLQIRQCRIEHYNRLTGRNYTLEDMYDFEKAREVFLYFAKGKTFEQAAKSWNGSGPMTIKYWEGVKTYLAT